MDCNTYPRIQLETEHLIDVILIFLDVEFEFSMPFGNLHSGNFEVQ